VFAHCRSSRLSAAIAAALLLGGALAACGGSGSSSHTSAPQLGSTGAATAPPQPPAGEDAPIELQGTWRLVSKDSPEAGLLFIISDSHYWVPGRFASGNLVVHGSEIAFFNAAIYGLTLPDGVGRYRSTIKGDRLRFEPIEEDPCGGRSVILAGTSYERVG
jgi:hypothetical protein